MFTNGYHFRAITLSRFGKYDEALKDLERAMELRPGLDGLYFSRGVTYFLAQQFDKAVADFDRYIRKEPKDPSAYLNRGASYLSSMTRQRLWRTTTEPSGWIASIRKDISVVAASMP